MFKDNKLRLLMTLAGFERIGADDDPDCTWIVPSSLTSIQLQETCDFIDKSQKDPITHYGNEDPIPVEEMLRRKTKPRPREEFDDDSDRDELTSEGEEEFLFPAGGPTNRNSDALAELKSKRRKRTVDNASDVEVDDKARNAKRKARALAELEKRRKLKSDVLVHESDDEDDEERDREFFAQEAERRKGQSLKVLEALRAAEEVSSDTSIGKKRKRRKEDAPRRKKTRHDDTDSEIVEDDLLPIQDIQSSPNQDQEPSTSDEEDSQTPLSSPQSNPLDEIDVNKALLQQDGQSIATRKVSISATDEEEEEDKDMRLPTNARMRGRFALLDDSDDD